MSMSFRLRAARAGNPAAPVRKCWRPSKRNAVMKKALMRRPTQQQLSDSGSGGTCPCCDAGVLRYGEEPSYVSSPFALLFLGINVRRWLRNRLALYCDACGTSFSGGRHLSAWSAARVSRRWADFGCVKFPLPRRARGRKKRRTDKSLSQTLIAQLHPRKRGLVNLKVGRALMKRDKKLARSVRWSFIRRGETPPDDGY